MAQEQPTSPQPAHAVIVRGADDQLGGLERLWAAGEAADPVADEHAWQMLSRALDASRRAAGERPLYEDE